MSVTKKRGESISRLNRLITLIFEWSFILESFSSIDLDCKSSSDKRTSSLFTLSSFFQFNKKEFQSYDYSFISKYIMYSIIIIFFLLPAIILSLYDIRMATVQIYHDSKYIPGYHPHRICTFFINTLRDCIYLCQNNDYCRTANYYDSNTGTMCTLFEENSFVGQIVSITFMMSVV
jgi:hypothetical protein